MAGPTAQLFVLEMAGIPRGHATARRNAVCPFHFSPVFSGLGISQLSGVTQGPWPKTLKVSGMFMAVKTHISPSE